MREFGTSDPSGTDLRWSARFGPDNLVQSYRAYKQEWHGRPTTVPSLVVDFGHSVNECSIGYVSWNGATDVTAWAIFQGQSADRLTETRRVDYHGFETEFAVSRDCVQVAAIVDGVLTGSNVVCPGS